jgi:hypothetical protein
MKCAADPALAGYRRRAFRTPEQRVISPKRRRYIPVTSAPPSEK